MTALDHMPRFKVDDERIVHGAGTAVMLRNAGHTVEPISEWTAVITATAAQVRQAVDQFHEVQASADAAAAALSEMAQQIYDDASRVLGTWTLVMLRNVARRHEVPGFSKMRKADLVQALARRAMDDYIIQETGE